MRNQLLISLSVFTSQACMWSVNCCSKGLYSKGGLHRAAILACFHSMVLKGSHAVCETRSSNTCCNEHRMNGG